MKDNIKPKGIFNNKVAKEIADKSFGYVLDCILGYSDDHYNMSDEASEFEQNFEEDLEEKNIVVTPRKIKIISEHYEKMRNNFIDKTRKKYYNENTKNY